ncbi:class I SAM-dependent methyltransferase [Candidatus Pacearchaeota archaeon]|nr:class I SAM-dependent methyltransferase [Candidatus Pacearchaeota archaeon]
MIRDNCLVCDSKNIEEIIDLGSHPFADTFIPESKKDMADMVFPLVCTLCNECGHVQTKYSTDPNARYSQTDYSYTSSNSSFSRNHWDSYAEEISEEINLPNGSLIAEIGSNDGYLSEQFNKLGYNSVGVDPSPYMAELAKVRGINTIIGLFEKETSEKFLNKYGQAKLVVANNVFNHSDNPRDFVKAVTKILSDKGYFVFEQPYWLTSIKTEKFDQIYHEHVSYFTVKSVKKLLSDAGLSIIYVNIVNYHGGSLRIIAQKNSKSSEAEKRILEEEEQSGIFDSETYKKFMQKICNQRNIFLERVYKLKQKNKPIVAVGAAAKGNTFLNFYNLNKTVIDYVTDSSPHKIGKYTPATRIPIVGDEIFKKYSEVYALILSWNLKDQLLPILSKINPNIQFISPEEIP